jgi:hypothetical protein
MKVVPNVWCHLPMTGVFLLHPCSLGPSSLPVAPSLLQCHLLHAPAWEACADACDIRMTITSCKTTYFMESNIYIQSYRSFFELAHLPTCRQPNACCRWKRCPGSVGPLDVPQAVWSNCGLRRSLGLLHESIFIIDVGSVECAFLYLFFPVPVSLP